MAAGKSPSIVRFQSIRVIDPSRKMDVSRDVYLVDGRLTTVAPQGRTIHHVQAGDWLLSPGLVDMHVHLREPGQEHKETLATGCSAALAGGFAAVACMPNTTPPIDSADWVREILRRATALGLCEVWPIAALTVGRQGQRVTDFSALREAGAAAFTDDGDGVESDEVMRQAGQLARTLNTVLVQHCEFHQLSSGGVVNAGATAQRLHLPPWDPRAEVAMIERDIRLVRDVGFRYHVAHVSTADGVALVRQAKADGLTVSAEVCPHHLLLADADIPGDDANFKMNPPLRSQADVEACRTALADGTIDCLVTDHAPHTPEEKSGGFLNAPFGIVGLETCLPLAVRAMVDSGRLSWPALIERMTCAPCRVLGRANPTLALDDPVSQPGPCSFTVIDPSATWAIDARHFRSKGRNTPFDGWGVRGRVVATGVAGQLRFVHDSVRSELEPFLAR